MLIYVNAEEITVNTFNVPSLITNIKCPDTST